MFLFVCLFSLLLPSTESGQDNPFRPDGDLSREADELVELLRGGRVSISEVLKNKDGSQQPEPTYIDEEQPSSELAVQVSGSSPPRNTSTPSSPASKADSPDSGRINGNLTEQEKKAAEAAESSSVEVQRGVVAPVAGESQVEHVVIKKKSKCQCCVIQWWSPMFCADKLPRPSPIAASVGLFFLFDFPFFHLFFLPLKTSDAVDAQL